tara:strand:- start:631 stop:1569 length:939 start_codon:yes stop_codon:yes gene_type:complete
MVTPNEVSTSSENESSLETTDSLPSGDELIIPANWDEQQSEPVATEEVSVTSDEAISDDVSPESDETSEITEESAVSEVAPDETIIDEASPEESGRMRTQDEWSKRESSIRQRENERETEMQSLRDQVSQLQTTYSDQVLDAEVRGYAQSLEAQLVAEGHDEAGANRLATQQANAAKASFQAEQRANTLQQQLTQANQSAEVTSKNASVNEMMRQYGVPESQRALLQGYSDPALLVEASKVLGEAEGLRKQQIAAKQAEVPSGGEANTFDGGVGQGGTITDQQWLNTVYASGSSNDHARANKVMRSMGVNLG